MSYLCKNCGLEMSPIKVMEYVNLSRDKDYAMLCPNAFCCETMIYIDDGLTWAIKSLWKKEINTLYCCSGHVDINDIYRPNRNDTDYIWGSRPYIMFDWPKNKKVITTFEDILKDNEFNRYFYLNNENKVRFTLTLDTHEHIQKFIGNLKHNDITEHIKQANDCMYHFQLLLGKYLSII